MKKLLTLALFTTYNKNVIKPIQLETLNGKQDDYHCYHVQQGEYLDKYLHTDDIFVQHLEDTIKECKQKNMKAIWIQLKSSQLKLASKLVDQGFEMHHCTDDYLLFSQWIVQNEKNRLPKYTTHAVGAGGLIINDNKILLVQEKNGARSGQWGIPGGLSNDGELIIEAAAREVKEETGLDTEPYDCFVVRDLPIANEYSGDLYFVILMKLKDAKQEIKIQQDEISNYKWVHLKDLQQFTATNSFRITQQSVMQAVVEYYESKKFGSQLFKIDTEPRMMYGQIKKYCLFKPNL